MMKTINNLIPPPAGTPFEKGRNIKRNKKAFTLVELIIVITILTILGTIGFISFQDYFADARDANRLQTMTNIENGLNLQKMKTKTYPMPEDPITITSSGVELSYQGYFGQEAAQAINMQKTPLDPMDEERYVYSISKDKKSFQLLAYMEKEENQLAYQTPITKTYADYSDRYPKPFGKVVGIILDTNNNPISGTGLDISTGSTNYKIIFSSDDELTASGYALSSAMYSKQGTVPESCPDGFIPVPGNAEFSTNGGFCVAQYEMGYADGLNPDSCDDGTDVGDGCAGVTNNNNVTTAYYTDWNSMHYQTGKIIVSKVGVYPIVNITQIQAIDACKTLGNGYHLITNNEWMTIARNIEANSTNWSSKIVGNGNLYNGVSSGATLGCNAVGGNIETRTYATKTGPGTDSICNNKRKHILSNGQTIWDLSGNVREHVNKDNTKEALSYNVGQTSIAGSSSGTASDDDGKYNQNDMKKYASALGYGIISGMGNLYYANGITSNIFLRGGSADNGTSGGVFTLYLNRSSGYMGRRVGFRCVK